MAVARASVDPPAGLFNLSGRRALVTGASRGIGRALAIGLASHGADVVCVARNAEMLKDTAQQAAQLGVRAEWIIADLRNEELIRTTVAQAAEKLGGIDILINNAADDHDSSVLDTELATWQRVLDLNLQTCFLLCREAGPHLIASGSGKVVNVASVLALVGVRDNAAYMAAKGGLLAFTRGLALEWARKGVQVNALCPGFIRTDMTSSLWQSPRGTEWVVKRTPIGRWGEVQDLVGPTVFLAAAASNFMTGQVVVVDGGWTVQ